MTILKGQVETDNGDILYPHTTADVVFDKNGKSVELHMADLAQLSNLNLLINGDFQVWQRGEKFDINAASNVYSADRWTVFNGANAYHVNKVNDGITISTDNQSADSYISQTIEVPHFLWGKKITMSYEGDLVKSSIHFNATVRNGLSGATSYTSTNGTTKTITTVVPYNTQSLSVNLFSEKGFKINWVKLEVGDKATPFIPRLYAEEELMCKRYYQKINYDVLGNGYIGGDGYAIFTQISIIPMRVKPTLTINDSSGLNIKTGSGKFKQYDPTSIAIYNSFNTATLQFAFSSGVLQDCNNQTCSVYYQNPRDIALDSEIY